MKNWGNRKFQEQREHPKQVDTCILSSGREAGLDVYQNPKWRAVRLTPDYIADFRILGSRIILSQPCGFATQDAVEKSLRLNEKVIPLLDEQTDKYVQIEDYSNLEGATLMARKQFIREVRANQRLVGIVFCNTSPLFRMSIKLGKRFYAGRHQVAIAEGITDAVVLAEKILRDAGVAAQNHKAYPSATNPEFLTAAPSQRPRFAGIPNPDGHDSLENSVKEILYFIGDINWDEEGFKSDLSIHPSNPLLPVFEAIKLIKTELDVLIGERKKAEKERARYEKHLQAVQKMEALGTLAGGVAHDFNNLLMGIQGRTSLLLESIAPDNPDQEHLVAIEDHVRSAAELTGQLLGLARGGKYRPIPTQVNDLVEDVIRMFGRTGKKIRIQTDCSPGLPLVEADQGQIRQVLLNLLINAQQAMPDGGRIHIQTEPVYIDETSRKPVDLPPGTYVRLIVADTGEGIDKAIQSKIFDPFFTTKKGGRGTGLGLASAYGIIKNHQGTITVKSEKKHGAAFTICLPAIRKSTSTATAVKPVSVCRGQGTVLLIDDEALIVEVGSAMLKTLGYQVLTAAGGLEGVATYAEKMDAVDLVILDMCMPDLDGVGVLKRLRAIEPDVRVLLSSGYSLDSTTNQLLQNPHIDRIQKPYSLKDLSEKLAALLKPNPE